MTPAALKEGAAIRVTSADENANGLSFAGIMRLSRRTLWGVRFAPGSWRLPVMPDTTQTYTITRADIERLMDAIGDIYYGTLPTTAYVSAMCCLSRVLDPDALVAWPVEGVAC